jgi:predicted DNA repair protein MutK
VTGVQTCALPIYLFAYIGQATRGMLMLVDDVVVLAKPALAQMDDIVALAKPAVTQSSGVVIDDAAVGAGIVGESQIAQHREYKVWGKIAVGSMINKTILSGVFLGLSVAAPIVPQILLGLGGAYLTYEGAHKVHSYMHKKHVAVQQTNNDDSESGIAEMIGKWSTQKGPLGALARFLGVDEK